jgi:hypothetical protein
MIKQHRQLANEMDMVLKNKEWGGKAEDLKWGV